jgi:hypothetical protein
MVLALIAAAPAVAASGYNYNSTNGYNGYYTAGKQNNSYRTTTTTRNYGNQQPARASSYSGSSRNSYSSSYDNSYNNGYNYNNYSNYNNGNSNGYVTRERQVTTRTYSSQERKYFLAHPFFQPLKGKFGSVTDFSYAKNGFKFDMSDITITDMDPNSSTYGTGVEGELALKGKAETTQFLVKEDFSFGLSDTLAIIGMVQYDSTKVKFKDWSSGDPENSYSDNGLNLFGIGIQNRFVDNNDWIAMVAGYFQHQQDTANSFIGELKAGYKVDRTTVYGLLRGGYSVLTKGDIYGAYVEEDGDYLMLSYKTDVKDIIYVEGGLGVFSVLSKDFTLNGELIYGHYDWHEQLNLKGAIGWQPGDMFALNLYGMVSLYDSADSKSHKYMWKDANPDTTADDWPFSTDTTSIYSTGNYDIKDYNEWKFGVQAVFYF